MSKLKLSQRFKTVLEDYRRRHPDRGMINQYEQYDELLLRDLEALEKQVEDLSARIEEMEYDHSWDVMQTSMGDDF